MVLRGACYGLIEKATRLKAQNLYQCSIGHGVPQQRRPVPGPRVGAGQAMRAVDERAAADLGYAQGRPEAGAKPQDGLGVHLADP